MGSTLKGKHSEVFETVQRLGILLKERRLKHLKRFKDGVFKGNASQVIETKPFKDRDYS